MKMPFEWPNAWSLKVRFKTHLFDLARTALRRKNVLATKIKN
jgi:hypothetical protein